MKDVLLIHPPYPYETKYPPLGLGYIAAVLEKANVSVDIYDMPTIGYKYDDLKKDLRRLKPKIVGISFMTCQYKKAQETAKAVKEVSPDIVIVVGGIHPSILPVETMKECPEYDFVIYGEGEETFKEFALNLLSGSFHADEIQGLGFRKGENVILSPPRELISDIDTIPFLAWHLLPVDQYAIVLPSGRDIGSSSEGLVILSSRGCPYQCTFCCHDAVFGKSYRMRSPENVFAELNFLHEKYGFSQFDFIDETMTIKYERVKKLCDLIINNNLKITWSANARVNTVDFEMLRLMKQAGCIRIDFGVESGSPKVLKNIKKGITVEQIRRAHQMVHEVGMKTTSLMMLGNPGESIEDVNMSLRLVAEIDTEFPEFSNATPYPGTVLFQQAKKKNWIRTLDWNEYLIGLSGEEALPVMRNEFFDHFEIYNVLYYATTFAITFKSLKQLKESPIKIVYIWREINRLLRMQFYLDHKDIGEFYQRVKAIFFYLMKDLSPRTFDRLISNSTPVTLRKKKESSLFKDYFKNFKNNSPQRVLFIRSAPFAVVKTLLLRFHEEFPLAKIDLICQKDAIDYFKREPYVAKILSIPKGMFSFKHILRLLPKTKRSSYDLFIIPYNEIESSYSKIELFGVLSGFPKTVGINLNYEVKEQFFLPNLKKQLMLISRNILTRIIPFFFTLIIFLVYSFRTNTNKQRSPK